MGKVNNMTDKQILKRVFEKAIKNGYLALHIGEFGIGNMANMMMGEGYAMAGLLHSHDFAKAFWGNSPACGNPICPTCPGVWTHRLQEIVLEENPIKYLEKFL